MRPRLALIFSLSLTILAIMLAAWLALSLV